MKTITFKKIQHLTDTRQLNKGEMYRVEDLSPVKYYLALEPNVLSEVVTQTVFNSFLHDPGGIGTETANSGRFTTLQADTFKLATGTPVNAVAAAKVLTVSNTPAEGNTVSVGGTTYKARRTALGSGAAASKVLTINTQPVEGETIVIDGVTYKIRRDALGAGVAASGILTSNETAPADGDTVTIGARVYRFKDTPAQANDIARSTATVCMLRLFKAMHLTGIAGSDYFAGTEAIPSGLFATHTSAFVITVTAFEVGVAGNAVAKNKSSANLDWDGATAFFTGGIDAQAANDVYAAGGTSACIDNLIIALTTGYVSGSSGLGTVTHPTVLGTKATTQSLTVTAKTNGYAGNAIAVSETLSDVLSKWTGDATALSGGIDPQAAHDVYCTTAETFIDNLVLAVTAGAGAGTAYGTGTVEHTLVTAVKASAATMTCTNRVKGEVGNATTVAKDGTNLSWAGTGLLTGGINATVSSGNELVFDASNLYICFGANTIHDANWLKTTLTSV